MLTLLIILLLPLTSYAHFDLSAGASFRSYPSLGGQANIQSGYNLLLWGSGPGANKKNPMYGLLRPAVTVASSAVINNYDARIEFYPISFIGLIAGKKYIKSDYENFTFFDCDKVRCMGTLERQYTQIKMALGYGRVLAMVNLIQATNTYSDEKDEGKPVAEFRFAALANPERDKMYRSQYLLGIKHNNKGILGVVAEYVSFSESGQTNNMDLLIYTTKPQATTYVFGIGQFSSSHQAKGLIGVFQMKTDFIPSHKMF